MEKGVYLGIDTSNYTTSLGIIGQNGELIANLKKPLPVKDGERGIRQSDAVFAHVKNIPDLMLESRKFLSHEKILGIGVSTRPRNIEGSYMPCFLQGKSVAYSIAAMTSAPLFEFSHQCGHIMAAIYSSSAFDILDKPFAALHISGGTTELLSVSRFSKGGFCAELVGGTSDLNAGQVIDRIGVYMGIPFPCGIIMEELALSYVGKIPKTKISANGTHINLSGLENQAKKLYDETCDKKLVSAYVFDRIGESIKKICYEYVETFGDMPFVFAGGVMSNSILKNTLKNLFNAYFAEPDLSRDNAVGIAYLTYKQLNDK